jgi:hypothetical protein
MKRRNIISFSILCIIVIFLSSSITLAGDATLSWDPPSTNADGTTLTDLAGYRVYFGTSSGIYSKNIDAGNIATYRINNLTDGLTYFFAVTAYDSDGNESEYSNEVFKRIQPRIDASFNFGSSADIPVTGDWNGDGYTDIGVFRKGYWYLDSNGNGVWEKGVDLTLKFGSSADIPVTGDWNGDGYTDIGVFRKGYWYLDSNGNGVWEKGVDLTLKFGSSADIPVTGDWNGDGYTDIGVFRKGYWYLDSNGNGVWEKGVDTNFEFGISTDIPITGDWNKDGYTDIGVSNNRYWYLDSNGNDVWD